METKTKNSENQETNSENQATSTHVEIILRKAQGKKVFKDTENRIGGSKKEKAAYRKVKLSGLPELEKNENNAIEFVRKDSVYPKIDVEAERSNNISSAVVFLKVKMRQSFAPAPSNNPEDRRAYISYADRIVSDFSNVKTVKEFLLVNRAMLQDAETFKDRNFRRIVGKRFVNFMYKISWNLHPAFYEERDNWEWAQKKVLTKKKRAELKINTYPPLTFIKRVGGVKITDEDVTVESIRQKFGFKEVEFGSALKDTESREHVRHFLGAMADLGSVLNMDITKINGIGNLSLAFASRGSGTASAHYERLRKVINLTKNNGGGAVAHEYGHYIDNILPLLGNNKYEYKYMASETVESVKNEKVKKAVKDILDYIYARKGAEQKLLVKKTIEASERLYRIPNDIIGDDIETYFYNFKQKYRIFNSIDQLSAKNIDVLGWIVKKFGYKRYEFTFESQRTLFYINSLNMSSPYWKKPCELFARAFETYIYDKLAKAGRSNNYLVHGAYFDRIESVYPIGEERNDLFVLYDNLMKVVKHEYSIGDFKEWTNEKVTECIDISDESKA